MFDHTAAAGAHTRTTPLSHTTNCVVGFTTTTGSPCRGEPTDKISALSHVPISRLARRPPPLHSVAAALRKVARLNADTERPAVTLDTQAHTHSVNI